MNGKAQGWKPWHYDDRNRVQHATSAQGGQKKSMAAVEGWKAEFFIPYVLMNPIVPSIPKSGRNGGGIFTASITTPKPLTIPGKKQAAASMNSTNSGH
jgi:hypothetical protein